MTLGMLCLFFFLFTASDLDLSTSKDKDKEAKTRYPLQLAALISPIFLAVMDPQLAGALKFNPAIMIEVSYS